MAARPGKRFCYNEGVMRPLALLSLLSPTLLGCADMLGLGGLTFEEPSTEDGSGGTTDVGAGGAAGGAASGGAPLTPQETGGSPSLAGGSGAAPGQVTTPSPTDDYFISVGPDALIAASYLSLDGATRGDSAAYVYQPSSGELQLLELAEDEPDLRGTAYAEGIWTHLLAPMMGAERNLLGYDSPTGIVSWGVVPTLNDAFTPRVAAGSSGWTHLTLTGPADAPLLVSFSANTGTFRMGPADLNAEEPAVASGVWLDELSEIIPFFLANQAGVLRLAPDQDQASFLPIVSGEFGPAVELPIPSWTWTRVVPFRDRDRLHLLLYSDLIGDVDLLALDEDAEALVHLDDGLWRTGLDQLLPVQISGRPWLLIYDRSSGILDLKDPFDMTPESVAVK